MRLLCPAPAMTTSKREVGAACCASVEIGVTARGARAAPLVNSRRVIGVMRSSGRNYTLQIAAIILSMHTARKVTSFRECESPSGSTVACRPCQPARPEDYCAGSEEAPGAILRGAKCSRPTYCIYLSTLLDELQVLR